MRYAMMGWIAVGWMVAAACSSGGGGSSATVESQAIRFADCTAARDYLVENLQSERELTAFADGVAVLTGGEAAHDAQAGGEAAPEEREFSNTNVQEVGVDEADFIKTDGDYLYAVSGTTFLLLDAWPAPATAELGRYEVEGDPFALYVHGDVAALLSRLCQAPESAPELEPRGGTLVKVTVLDVTDKAAPALVREIYLEGSYVDSRMVAGRVYVVTSYEQPVTADAGSAGDGGVVEGGTGVVASATATDVEALFPRRLDRIAGDTQGEVEPVCACEEIYRPAEPNGPGVISLVAVDLAHPTAELAATALVSDGGTVYGAQESLYLATANDGPWLWWGAPVVAVTDGVQAAAVADPTPKTVIHKFTLGATPTYAASGTVAGWVLNPYSMSEHAGILRIATTEENWWSGGDPVNAVYTLAQQGDRLERVGAVTGLGKPGERIYAVRFLGDRGFVVTFQQIDPLVALDLSDPAAPRVAGELEVEGLSTYLHPIGVDRLLAVGQEAGGVNLSLFDVSDLAHPRLVAQQALGAGSYSEAQYDPKAFTYFAALGVLALPVSAWTDLTVAAGESPTYDLFNGLYLYDVDPDAGFTLRGTLDHSDLYRDEANGFWYAPSEIRRSFFLRDAAAGTFVYSVSHRGVKVSDFADLTAVATVDLPAPPTYWLVDDTVVALPEPAAVLP